MSAVIAIVGRPNVGKSALFNRIAGRRIAIVHDEPGVTRDRVMAEVEWHGRPFTLVDTGGIGLLQGEKTGDPIIQAAFVQVQMAIDEAQIIVLVVNVKEGVAPLDREVAARLRACGKPVFVAVNKVDAEDLIPNAAEFCVLGFPDIFPVSAIHNTGIEALLDQAISRLPKPAVLERTADTTGAAPEAGILPEAGPLARGPLKLAIVGRPNVGKSSIVNALTQSERVIVSPIPGTTRDAIDVPFEVDTDGVRQKYILIDTAGLRKHRRVDNTIELFSVQRTQESIVRSDIVVFILDAETGILEQDKKIADKIIEAGKACILVVNKWDLAVTDVDELRHRKNKKEAQAKKRAHGSTKAKTTLAEFGQWVQDRLFFLDYAPVIFTSATTGLNLDRMLESIRYVAAQLQQKIPTSLLNRTLQAAIEQKQPVSAQGHHLRFFYATQVSQAPPTFLLFVNRDEDFSDAYNKYLIGNLRRAFGYEGCLIRLQPKARPKTIEPKRRRSPGPNRAGRKTFPRREQNGVRMRAEQRSGPRKVRPKPR